MADLAGAPALTAEEYISRLTAVFREVRRVLRPDGTLWVNIADSYCGTGSKGDARDPKYPQGRNGQKIPSAKRYGAASKRT